MVALHPGGALGRQLRPHSCRVIAVLADDQTGEVAEEMRRVDAARSADGDAVRRAVGGGTTTMTHTRWAGLQVRWRGDSA